MYRVWYSTESFANFIIDKTVLSTHHVVKKKLAESDIKAPNDFYKIPDHIRKILYLDCVDIIVEKDNNPILCIEETKEAGTGHNVTQRFSRIMAALENKVPAIYIQPEGVIVSRKTKRVDANGNAIMSSKWDTINPFLFAVMERATNLYQMPALFYYYPTDIETFRANPTDAPNIGNKGIRYDTDVVNYAGCPDSTDGAIVHMLSAINEIVNLVERYGVADYKNHLMGNRVIQEQRAFMNREFVLKSDGANPREMSPATKAITVPTAYLMNYLSQYEKAPYCIGELLRQRENSVIYQVDSTFRGDPYAGNLSAIDCLMCRTGNTYEDRDCNLILAFGEVVIDHDAQTIEIFSQNHVSVDDMFKDVQQSSRCNLLMKNYDELRCDQIPRYFMQVRYGSVYSKNKHVRVYSHLADAILFEDGSLWRDA